MTALHFNRHTACASASGGSSLIWHIANLSSLVKVRPAAHFPVADNPLIDDGLDLKEIYFTNNTTNLFWRVDLYDAPVPTFSLYICLNTDNDASTGKSDLAFECASEAGVDFYIVVDNSGFADLF